MKVKNISNLNELADQVELLLLDLMIQKQKQVLRGFFPTGRSPDSFYQLLQKRSLVWRKKFQVLQIDEFEGEQGFFYQSLKAQLIDPLNLGDLQEVIDSKWTELEFKRHILKVGQQPIDFCLLGLGPNGHIGFHEPGVGDESFLGGKLVLSQESFNRVPGAPGKTVLTFGAGSFLKAEKVILLVVGQEKKEIFERFQLTEPSQELPATLLKRHPDFTVLACL